MLLTVVSKSQLTNMDSYIKWYKFKHGIKEMVLVLEDVSNGEYKYTFIVKE